MLPHFIGEVRSVGISQPLRGIGPRGKAWREVSNHTGRCFRHLTVHTNHQGLFPVQNMIQHGLRLLPLHNHAEPGHVRKPRCCSPPLRARKWTGHSRAHGSPMTSQATARTLKVWAWEPLEGSFPFVSGGWCGLLAGVPILLCEGLPMPSSHRANSGFLQAWWLTRGV